VAKYNVVVRSSWTEESQQGEKEDIKNHFACTIFGRSRYPRYTTVIARCQMDGGNIFKYNMIKWYEGIIYQVNSFEQRGLTGCIICTCNYFTWRQGS